MKNLLVLFVFCFIGGALSAQKDFKGRVIDAATKEPIPYVNIGIVDAGVGTVSDEEGLFHLYLDPSKYNATAKVLFSALGYETYYKPVSSIKKVFNEYPEILLKPSLMELNEVVVSNKGERFIPDKIGYRNYGEENFGYWKDNIALGGELATRIIAKDGLRRLDKFEFEVWHNPSDSLLLRVNIYDDDGTIGRPGTNLNTSGKSITCVVKKDAKNIRVDLTPYDIYVNNDFMISLELLQVYGETELGLILAAATNQYGSFRKYSSQDKWEKLSETNMAYFVESSLMVKEKVAQRFEKKKAKIEKKQRMVSGFAILRGKMLKDVSVFNNSTKEAVTTDEKGRYTIPADKNDILSFTAKGLKDIHLKVSDKPTMNAVMKEASN